MRKKLSFLRSCLHSRQAKASSRQDLPLKHWQTSKGKASQRQTKVKERNPHIVRHRAARNHLVNNPQNAQHLEIGIPAHDSLSQWQDRSKPPRQIVQSSLFSCIKNTPRTQGSLKLAVRKVCKRSQHSLLRVGGSKSQDDSQRSGEHKERRRFTLRRVHPKDDPVTKCTRLLERKQLDKYLDPWHLLTLEESSGIVIMSFLFHNSTKSEHQFWSQKSWTLRPVIHHLIPLLLSLLCNRNRNIVLYQHVKGIMTTALGHYWWTILRYLHHWSIPIKGSLVIILRLS